MAGGPNLGFQSLDREMAQAELPVEGKFPSWLEGALLRTGPAKFEVGIDDYKHWFDGLAMLHRFEIADGAVTYTNRFLDSPAYRSARDTGKIAYSEFATDPCRTLFQRVASAFVPPTFGNNANVNIIRSGNDFLALTETPLPVKFAPETLDVLGVTRPAPGQLTTAHPHRAPASGDLASYATKFGPFTSYRIFTDTVNGQRHDFPRIPVQLPSYMHSFAITERYIVLAEFPFVVIPAAIPLFGRPFITNYRWRPGRGTRFRVVDLNTGRSVGTYQGESFFAFHHVNAYEQGREIFVDVCGYEDADVVSALYLDNLRSESARVPQADLRRYRIPLDGGDVTREPLPDIPFELPRVDYGRRNGRPYRYAYGIASASGGFPDQIVKADVQDGSSISWSEPDAYPGEAVFVRTPDTDDEDAGILLTVVLDRNAGTSFLLALDATDLSEIGRARVPHHIPLGFHGGYFPQA